MPFPSAFPGGMTGVTDPDALADKYLLLGLSLLPPGRAWTRVLGKCFAKLTDAMMAELSRIEERSIDLVRESMPGDAVELLDEWEEVTGLPDLECYDPITGDADRQDAIINRLAETKTQSKPDFQIIGTQLGYALSFKPYHVSHCGVTTCGTALHGPQWHFAREVITGSIDTATDERLSCRMDKHVHSYGQLNYTFEDYAEIDAVTNVRHHYRAGYHNLLSTDTTRIDELTNRIGGFDSFDNTSIADADLPKPTWKDGFRALNMGQDTVDYFTLGGLTDTSGTPTANHFLSTADFHIWVAFYLTSAITTSGTPDNNHKILATSNGTCGLYAKDNSGEKIVFHYDDGVSANTIEFSATPGNIYVAELGFDGGTTVAMRLNGTSNNQTTTGPVTDGGTWALGRATNGLIGYVFEVVSSDYEAAGSTLDDVRQYFGEKYGVAY